MKGFIYNRIIDLIDKAMIGVRLKKLETINEIEDFRNSYEERSGLPVPLEYLIYSDTYGVFSQDEMIGGFVIGESSDLRTLQLFVSEDNKPGVLSNLGDLNRFCEACCFWVNANKRKSMLTSIQCWIKLTKAIRLYKRDFVIYGTLSRGLAKVYNIPRRSFLIHQDLVNNSGTYVFMVRLGEFSEGVFHILLSKMVKNKNSADLKILEKEIHHEISK